MRRLIAALIAGAVLALVPATAAMASPVSGGQDATAVPTQVQTAGLSSAAVCANYGTQQSMDATYLPMDRWINKTSQFHSRAASGFAGLEGLAVVSQRAAQGTMFSFGNLLFSLTGQATSMASQFCPLVKVGGIIDQSAAALAQAMLDSSIVAGIVVVALIGMMLMAVRGRGAGWMKNIFTKALVLGVFAIMLVGSSHSTGGGINGSTADYQPGVGSPGWFATTIDTTVSNLATLPAQAISSGSVSRITSLSGSDASDPLNCERYNIALLRLYADVANGRVDANGNVTDALDGVAAPAMVVSNLWEISGLNAFTVAQFGSQNSDGKMRIACRMLELESGIPVSGTVAVDGASGAQVPTSSASQASVWAEMNGLTTSDVAAKINPKAPAWHSLANAEQDKAYFAFATCSPDGDDFANITKSTGWHVRRGPVGQLVADDSARNDLNKDGATTTAFNDACYNFYNTSGETVDGIFDWGDGSDKVNKTVDLPLSTTDLVNTLHGTGASGGSESVISYMVASISVLVVFGGLSLVVMAAKLVSMFMLFTVFLMMVATLLPNSNPDKLGKYAKEYVSWSLLSAFSLLIMSAIILFTKVIIVASSSLTGGPTSFMTMLMAGFAPALAAFGVHRGFTQMGMPSPMTVKGGLGWGKAIAGGAAVGAVPGGVQALAGRAQNAAAGIGRRALNSGKGAVASKLGLANAGKAGTQKAPVAGKSTASAAPKEGERLGADGKKVEDWQSILSDSEASADRKKQAREALAQERIDAAHAAGEAARIRDQVGAASGVRASLAAARSGVLDAAADKKDKLVDGAKRFASDPVGAARRGLQNAGTKAWQGARYAASNPAAALRTAAKIGALGAVGVAGVATAGLAPAAAVGAVYAANKLRRAATQRKESLRSQQLQDYREAQHEAGVAAQRKVWLQRQVDQRAQARADSQQRARDAAQEPTGPVVSDPMDLDWEQPPRVLPDADEAWPDL